MKRTRVSEDELNVIHNDVIDVLIKGTLGFYAVDIGKQGERIIGGGAYKLLCDYCERKFEHRPGHGTMRAWIEEAQRETLDDAWCSDDDEDDVEKHPWWLNNDKVDVVDMDKALSHLVDGRWPRDDECEEEEPNDVQESRQDGPMTFQQGERIIELLSQILDIR